MDEVTVRFFSNALTTEFVQQALTSRPNVEAKLNTLLLFDIFNSEILVIHNVLANFPIKNSVWELQVETRHFAAPFLQEVDAIDLVGTRELMVNFLYHIYFSKVLCVHQLHFVILTLADESIQNIARLNFLSIQD